MKKKLITLLLTIVCTFTFAQKIIEIPDYGYSTYPGKITKIELLDTTTVVHFHLKMRPGLRFVIPEKTYIQDVSGDKKLYVTNGTGVKLFKRERVPSSGELYYELYFPKLKPNVKTIDFGENTKRGSWFIYDIVINEYTTTNSIPKELRGNWMLADGSNQWHYGFKAKNAIVENAIWNYKSIVKKRKKYTITLEKEGAEKTIFAKLNQNGLVDFGDNLKKLKTYSLNKIYNPNYKVPNDRKFKDAMFKTDSATYSGVIKGFTSKIGVKTGTVHVFNALNKNRNTYLIKISKNGYFSVKFPVNYPQHIYVRLPGIRESIFVAPGKEVFHYIKGKESLFMGDYAKVNSDLKELDFIRYFDNKKTRTKIGVTPPEDYKNMCFTVRDRKLKALDSVNNIQLISTKAYQIKKLDIQLGAMSKALGYDIYRRSVQRRNKSVKSEQQKIPFKPFVVEKSFYNFIPQEIIHNKTALVTTNYDVFMNRLIFAPIFRGSNKEIKPIAYIVERLQKNNISLTDEIVEMSKASKEIQTPEIIEKQNAFNEKYGAVQQAFYKKHATDYKEFSKNNKSKSKHDQIELILADYVVAKGDTLSTNEFKMITALKSLKTPEELAKEKAFNMKYGKVIEELYNNYRDNIKKMNNGYLSNFNKMHSFFGTLEGFMFDVIRSQWAAERLKDFNVYNSYELASLQKDIKDPFISNYLAVENEKTKAEIEINKTKELHNVHTVEKTEGEELFASMIKKFKGKVIYVDFWATWCGPCTSGIRKIAPLKEEMKDDNVVFLYITNPTSPERTWKNSVAKIRGEHYRVTQDQWNYLTDAFKINGIPHYALVNKEGKVVKRKMNFTNSNKKVKVILEAEIKK